MAAKKPISPELQRRLDNPMTEETFRRYVELSEQAKPLTDEIALIKDRVKSKMLEAGVDSQEFGEFVASLSALGSVMNEERLVERLQQLGHEDCIVMVPKVDADKLQKLIYDKIVTEAELATCMDPKPNSSRTFTLKRKKAKKNVETANESTTGHQPVHTMGKRETF